MHDNMSDYFNDAFSKFQCEKFWCPKLIRYEKLVPNTGGSPLL